MRTFLVTGGAGFIGSHIAEALVGRGDRVRVLDNLSTGRLTNMAGFRERVEFIEGDLFDADSCGRGGPKASSAFFTRRPWLPCRLRSSGRWTSCRRRRRAP